MQKKKKNKNKQSTRVCHTLRQTFSKLSFAHDMKALIALACFPYNLDEAFSWTGDKEDVQIQQVCAIIQGSFQS